MSQIEGCSETQCKSFKLGGLPRIRSFLGAARPNSKLIHTTNKVDLTEPTLNREFTDPYVDASVNNCPVVAYFDTGAEISLINEKIYKQIVGNKATIIEKETLASTFSRSDINFK